MKKNQRKEEKDNKGKGTYQTEGLGVDGIITNNNGEIAPLLKGDVDIIAKGGPRMTLSPMKLRLTKDNSSLANGNPDMLVSPRSQGFNDRGNDQGVKVSSGKALLDPLNGALGAGLSLREVLHGSILEAGRMRNEE
jgi:uncharacterized protein YodC (DUF2158 family)